MGVAPTLTSMCIFAAAALATPAFADSHDLAFPSGPSAFVGAWRLGHDGEGASTCVLKLGAAGVLGGYRILVPSDCKGAVERSDEIFAWFGAAGGDLVMVDAARQALYRFHRLDSSTWATDGAGDERYLLVKIQSHGHR